MSNQYTETRTKLLNSATNPEMERIYAIADWAQGRNISFDNLPKELYLPEQYRELFNVSVRLLDTAMQIDFDNQMSNTSHH